MRFHAGILLCALGLAVPRAARAQGRSGFPDAPSPTVDAVGKQEDDSSVATRETQREKAAAQIREEEKQRILGVLPNFGTSYRGDAVSLTAGQKIDLAFHSAVDPATLGIAALVAGFEEANDDYGSGFGWDAQGFGKRVGAAYLDAFDGSMIGGGILPALLHQDPRYFRLGHGTKKHRVLYALATTVTTRHDNSHQWEPNYSNIGGNIAAGAISNLYYPNENSGWAETLDNAAIVTLEGAGGAVFEEFWPDISRKLIHRDPTHGLDAQMLAQDAEKEKKQPMLKSPK